jgi:flagellar basal-body rod modification protein FlgD
MSGSISSTTSSPASAGTAAASSATFGKDFQTFLTMLTTQLKNQDPTKAMDTTEMTNQLVAFSQVEQQINMNANLERMIGLQQAAELTASQGLLGKTVEVASDQLALQDGSATLVLPAADAARTATISVLDARGLVVQRQDVTLQAGGSSWSWDGKTTNGTQLEDGAYRYSIAGRDAAGEPVTIAATVLGRVTAAEREGSAGDLQLVMGKLAVSFDTVRRVVN